MFQVGEMTSHLTGVVLDDVAEGLQGHLSEAEPLGVLLGLHLVALAHGQQSVEVLGLGAHVVQQAGRKHLGKLQRREGSLHRWSVTG